MKALNILCISDKFVTYENMCVALKNALKKYNITFHTDIIHTEWPDIAFKYDRTISEYVDVDSDLLEKIQDKDIVITHVAGIKDIHFKKADRLKVIGCVRSMPVNIDVNAAREQGIALVYAPGRSTEAVAEFTLGVIIALRRKIIIADKELKEGFWNNSFFYYSEASSAFNKLVVGIIGFGHIGRQVCKLLQPFTCRVVLYDPYVDEMTIVSYGAEKKMQIKELLQESDIVTIHARPHDLQSQLLGEKELSWIKKTAYIINTSRGYLVDYHALYTLLKEGRIAGAALDTYEVEPLDTYHPLFSLDNVITTPHIAGATRTTADGGLQMVCAGIGQWLIGRRPKNLFDGHSHYRFKS